MDEAITKSLFLSTRDKAAEVALRKELLEHERQQKLEAKRKEQEEKLKRIGHLKNQQLLQRAREKTERELQKSKAVIDRRLAQLEQEKVRKEEILTKAHSATSRTAQNSQKKIFAFGSSTPRELSYLEKLSKDQKQYDRRLAPSTPSSGASPATTPPRDVIRQQQHQRGPKLLLGNSMTSSLYVPHKAKPMAPRVSPPKRTERSPQAAHNNAANKLTPTKANNNPMTQSLYVSKKSAAPRSATLTTTTRRNASPSKPSPAKRSPANSINSNTNLNSAAQRKPPIPTRANNNIPPTAAARAPPKAQPIEKNEPPKPKTILPRKAIVDIQKSQENIVGVAQLQTHVQNEEPQRIPSEEPGIVAELTKADEHDGQIPAPQSDEDLPPRPISPVAKTLANESEEILNLEESKDSGEDNVSENTYSDDANLEKNPMPDFNNQNSEINIPHSSETHNHKHYDNGFEEPQVVVYQPKSLQEELMEASSNNENEGIDFGDAENQIIIKNENEPLSKSDKAGEEIVEDIEAKQPLIEQENIEESVEEHYKNLETKVIHDQQQHIEEIISEPYPTTAIVGGHDQSFSIDDAISGLANLQLQTPPQKPSAASEKVVEQNFVDFGLGDETPIAEPKPPHFEQNNSKFNELDLSPLKKDGEKEQHYFEDDHDGHNDQDDGHQSNGGKETSRIESPDHAPFSSSSSAKESDAENSDIIKPVEVKKEKASERKARLSEIMAKVRQGTPPTAPEATTAMDQSVDAKLLALKLIEQRRQEKSSSATANNNGNGNNGNGNGNHHHNGPRLSLAEELAEANAGQTKQQPPLDILPGQPIYDNSDYHVVLNGKTTPPEDPSHVQQHHHQAAQDFLNLISPFLGSGLSPPSPNPNPSPAATGGGGNPGGLGFGQGLASAFTNSGNEYSNNPFGDLFQLGQTFSGLLKQPPPPPGAAKQPPKPAPKPKPKPKQQQPQADAPPPPPPQVTPSPFMLFRPTLIPLADEPLLRIFKPRGSSFHNPPSQPPAAPSRPGGLMSLADEPLLKIFKQRESSGRSSQGPSRAGSPFLRLTENFGRNFFSMMDELEEYTGPTARAGVKGVSGGLTGNGIGVSGTNDALSDSTATNTPQDFLSAHNLMQAFLKATSRDPRNDLRPMPIIYDGTEAGRNRPLMDQLFESDILLTSKQMKAIVLAEAEKKAGGRRRTKRKVITGGVYRWPANRPIPFGWGHHDKDWRQTIRKGLIKWEKETCLRFQEEGRGKDRLEFFKGSGCYSSVGKVGGKQKVSIGNGCEDEGIVSHEVGHALGFWHEQSRPDRDSFIQLNDKFIAGGTEGNFAKRSDLEADGMGLPYDLGSVMHYGPSAFTTDWDEITIKTKDKKYQHTIGQRSGPSFIDVKQINRLYCNDLCKGAPTVCKNEGYPDPNNCMICKCPPGFGGKDCSIVEASICGGELTALQGTWQHLTHTGKDKCIWRVKANKARIRFIVDTVQYKCDTTCRSFVEIKHMSDFQQIGFRSCCEEKDLEVLSEQDEIIIIHDGLKMSSNRGGSFALRYISDHGAPLPKPPPPVWVPGRENRAFRGVAGKGNVIEKFILNALPRVRDPNRPAETTLSIFTDYVASSLLGTTRDKK